MRAEPLAPAARHFLLFSVPPYERAPVALAVNRLVGDVRVKLSSSIAAWNAVLRLYVRELPRRYPGASARLVDTWTWLDDLLDRADEQGFVNTKSWCPLYARGIDVSGVPEELSLEECGGSVRRSLILPLAACDSSLPSRLVRTQLAQHFWYDGVHPTWAVHRLLAASIRQQLSRSAAGASLELPSQADLDKHFPLEQLTDEERGEREQEYRRTVLSGEQGASAGAGEHDDGLPSLYPVLA